jgi:hypothetical protein
LVTAILLVTLINAVCIEPAEWTQQVTHHRQIIGLAKTLPPLTCDESCLSGTE